MTTAKLVEDPELPVPGFPSEGPELEEANKQVLSKITRHVIPMDLAFVVFPMPSNLILERMKMNVWIALLVFAWGCITTLSIFIFNGASLVVFRFCLGLVEAGISPGVIYFGTEAFRWIWGDDWLAVAISYTLMFGFQIIFDTLTYVATGLPAIFLSLFFYFFLPNSPNEARFLTERDQKILLASRSMAASAWSDANRTTHSLFWSTVSNSKNWLYAFCGMFTIACMTGINGFAPAIIYESGSDLFTTILVMLGWSYHSVYYGERFWHAFSALFLALLALGVCTVFVYLWDLNFVVALLAVYQSLVVSVNRYFPSMTRVSEMVNSVLGSTSIGIGLYYAVLGFGGWLGPFLMGYARNMTGDHVVSLALMCASLGIAISLFSVIHVTQRTVQIELGSQMQLQYDFGASASQSDGAKYEPKIETTGSGGAAILV